MAKEGAVYIAVNDGGGYHGLVKIGHVKAKREHASAAVARRMKQLSGTGGLSKFRCVEAVWIGDCQRIERLLHKVFKDQRHQREFFRMPQETAQAALQLTGGPDVTPGRESHLPAPTRPHRGDYERPQRNQQTRKTDELRQKALQAFERHFGVQLIPRKGRWKMFHNADESLWVCCATLNANPKYFYGFAEKAMNFLKQRSGKAYLLCAHGIDQKAHAIPYEDFDRRRDQISFSEKTRAFKLNFAKYANDQIFWRIEKTGDRVPLAPYEISLTAKREE